MELYGFSPEEITPLPFPSLEADLDPKAAWVLRNLHLFPVDVSTAEYETLLRIPGIGQVYAQRIIAARKFGGLSFEALKKIGVSAAKTLPFILCRGKSASAFPVGPATARRLLSVPIPKIPPIQISLDMLSIQN